MLYFIRLLIFLVLLVPYLVYKVVKKKKIRIITVIVLVIIGIIISLSPFDNKIFTFKTIEEAFNYSFFNEDILKTVDTTKGTFIVYGHDCDIDGYTFVSKSNDTYEIIYPNRIISEISYTSGDYNLYIETFDDNKMVMLTTDNVQKEPSHGHVVIDNKSTKFTYYYCKHKKEMVYKEGYYAPLTDDANYNISIDGNVLELK